MQLILDSEPITGIQEKMNTIEESPELNLKDTIDILKNEVNSSNKEKIQCQENIMNGAEDAVNGNNEANTEEVQNIASKNDEDERNIEEKNPEEPTSHENNVTLVDKNDTNGIAVTENNVTLVDKNDTNGVAVTEDERTENTTNDKQAIHEEKDQNEKVVNTVEDSSVALKEKQTENLQNVEEMKESEPSETTKEGINTEEDVKKTTILKELLNMDTEVKNKEISTVKEALKNDPKNSIIANNSVTEESKISEEENVEIKNTEMKEPIENEISEQSTQAELKSDADTKEGNIQNAETKDLPTDNSMKFKEISENEEKIEKISKNVEEPTLNLEEIKDIEIIKQQVEVVNDEVSPAVPPKIEESKKVSTLSNSLNILSDDDDENDESSKTKTDSTPAPADKQCINIEDDDDIMLIDEETPNKEKSSESKELLQEPAEKVLSETKISETDKTEDGTIDLEIKTDKVGNNTVVVEKGISSSETGDLVSKSEVSDLQEETKIIVASKEDIEQAKPVKPLLPENFLKTYKKSIADMTRDELEEFCILKIVESVVDRSCLSEIQNKLKAMAQNIEEYKKKAMMLGKQNRDLQVVLKSVQEEQKKKVDAPITPLKITRSVGMQVLMTEKPGIRKKPILPNSNNIMINRNTKAPNQSLKTQKPANNQQIPVPRLVPANNPAVKPVATVASPVKTASPMPNGKRNSLPVQKQQAEKRQRLQSDTVDLTDDEPPPKVTPRSSPAPPVRLVSPQNLLAPQRQPFGASLNCPRKVYIPISGPQNQTLRPATQFMLKPVTPTGPRQRGPTPQIPRMPQNAVRVTRIANSNRHPAPLPDAMKQYQPPNWKALPPAPDLKLSKVENGIVISWKIEGYEEDSYEEIASYQLYAYQETSSPPSTALWKKIGDVKALPLPMACTLTQFMAGFKYYFAVRAVDVRSRLGPFSLPGSILLLNKM